MYAYFFNKITLGLVIVIGVVVTSSLNELTKYAEAARLSNIQQYIQEQRAVSSYRSQEACQTATGMVCSYESCDFVPTGDATLAEVCGGMAEGWRATSVAIPAIYLNAPLITLTLTTETSVGTLVLNTATKTISYESKSVPAVNTNAVLTTDITRTVNKLILYSLSGRAERPVPSDATKKASVTVQNTVGATQETQEYSCAIGSCSRELNDAIQTFIRLLSSSVVESSVLPAPLPSLQ